MEDDPITFEELEALRRFKVSLFDLYWEKFGFFYIHVLPHPELQMGSRGLVGKEKEGGVVLAFGATACKDISSEEEYLYAELQFGMKWEKLLIPWDSVYRIFDKTQNSLTQLRVLKEPYFHKDLPKPPKKNKAEKSSDSNVIQIDFSKKR